VRRRSAILLIATHGVAFALPVGAAVAAIVYVRPAMAKFHALFAESYSRQVAEFDVAAGDAHAGRTGLKRHLDRVAATRQRRVSAGASGDHLLNEDCIILSEMAYLSDPSEREATARKAFEACGKTRGGTYDAAQILAIGARWVRLERGDE
jgi:hypothetical protein